MIGIQQFQGTFIKFQPCGRAAESRPQLGVKLVQMREFIRRLQGNLIQSSDTDEFPAERVVFFNDSSSL